MDGWRKGASASEQGRFPRYELFAESDCRIAPNCGTKVASLPKSRKQGPSMPGEALGCARRRPSRLEKILIAAARLFATHRFHEVRMEDIAAAVCAGKGTLYRYFKDKEELYLALLDRTAAGLRVRIDEGVGAVVGLARNWKRSWSPSSNTSTPIRTSSICFRTRNRISAAAPWKPGCRFVQEHSTDNGDPGGGPPRPDCGTCPIPRRRC